MPIRLLFLTGTLLLLLIQKNDGYVRTYADEHYGRIRGSNSATGVNAGIVFLIMFACIVGGFFALCIIGTIIFGIFDNGFLCSFRAFLRRNETPSSPVYPSDPSISSSFLK